MVLFEKTRLTAVSHISFYFFVIFVIEQCFVILFHKLNIYIGFRNSPICDFRKAYHYIRDISIYVMNLCVVKLDTDELYKTLTNCCHMALALVYVHIIRLFPILK